MKWQRFILGSIAGSMLAVFLAFSPTAAQAQVSFGVQIGTPPSEPPVCQWGYYDYGSYACAPRGYWGPEYFYRGVFVGVGPWYGWGYNHGWGRHRFNGYYRWQDHEWGNNKFRDRDDHAGWRSDRARGEWHEPGRGWQRDEHRGNAHGENHGHDDRGHDNRGQDDRGHDDRGHDDRDRH